MYIWGEKLKDICDLFLNHWNFKHNAPLGASHNERSEWCQGGVRSNIRLKRRIFELPRCYETPVNPDPLWVAQQKFKPAGAITLGGIDLLVSHCYYENNKI